MTDHVLDADKLDAIIRDCLFRNDDEVEAVGEDNAVMVEGIVHTMGFHPDRLEAHRAEITAMLMELPDVFMRTKGGGMSFLQACDDRHGRQWTGLHQSMEQLFVLGMAIGKVSCPLPRSMWDVLPGSVPYYVVFDD